MVEKIASHNRSISKNAATGFRKPKNIIDQRIFSPSCVKKIMSASFFCLPLLFQMIASERPIKRYKTVHTGPKIAFGGEKNGLVSDAYQVGIAESVKIVPNIPASSQIIIAAINEGSFLIVNIIHIITVFL